jgi:hypothetical protein
MMRYYPSQVFTSIILLLLFSLSCHQSSGQPLQVKSEDGIFRPPAVPLIVHTPYFSIWSSGDRLTDKNTENWIGTPQQLNSLIRIDGKAYRLMGVEPSEVTPFKQTLLTVLPLRTIAKFSDGSVEVTMIFMTPSITEDIDLFSRPVTYLTWVVRSLDGGSHEIQLYFDASTMLVVNKADQMVSWNSVDVPGLTVLRAGSTDQPVLKSRGDQIRIDWGYLYLGAPRSESTRAGFGKESTSALAFVNNGQLPSGEITSPVAPGTDSPVLAMIMNLGQVGSQSVSRHLMIAYDEIKAIRYFTQELKPYWKRNGLTAEGLLQAAENDYPKLIPRCERFDIELMQDLTKAGGNVYATLGALAYRQTLGMHDLAGDSQGKPLLFSKEPSSSGNIHTVDVFFPSSPLLLLFNPGLLRATMISMLDYCNSNMVKHNSCPHDLGVYPHAYGCWNGDGEIEIMPVEETADMLIMLAAVSQIEGNAKMSEKYWPLLTGWAGYLKNKGWDLDLQLCTDDFTGHLARNVNLSMKSTLAIGSFSKMALMLGRKDEASYWRKIAQEFATNLVKAADEGDHTVLALGNPGTWSQKYNLVWDRILDLDLFAPDISRREVAWYKNKVMNPYGVPLDSRDPLTKLDWSVWSASLADNQQDFIALIEPVYRLLNESPQRVPMGDLLETKIPKWRGFKARPVVGGVFIKMLYDKKVWTKWAKRAPLIENNWAPFPVSVPAETLLESSELRPREWYYAGADPGDNWTRTEPDYKIWIGRKPGWRSVRGGFGAEVNEKSGIFTRWDGNEMWLRKPFVIRENDLRKNLILNIRHAGPVEVYFNEKLAATLTGSSNGRFEAVKVNPEAAAVLLASDLLNTMAIHCLKAESEPSFDLSISTK